MKPKVLLIGATGIFGRKFTEKYNDVFDIIGVARREVPSHARYQFLKADLTTELDKIIEFAKTRFGAPDHVINAAVVADYRPVVDPNRDFESEIQINYISVLNLIRASVNTFWQNPVENRSHRRSFLNLSSIVGSHVFKINSDTHWSYATYAASKAAINSLTFYLAHDLARFGVRINAISPVSFPTHVSTDLVCQVVKNKLEDEETGKVMELSREFFREFSLPEQVFNAHSDFKQNH